MYWHRQLSWKYFSFCKFCWFHNFSYEWKISWEFTLVMEFKWRSMIIKYKKWSIVRQLENMMEPYWVASTSMSLLCIQTLYRFKNKSFFIQQKKNHETKISSSSIYIFLFSRIQFVTPHRFIIAHNIKYNRNDHLTPHIKSFEKKNFFLLCKTSTSYVQKS